MPKNASGLFTLVYGEAIAKSVFAGGMLVRLAVWVWGVAAFAGFGLGDWVRVGRPSAIVESAKLAGLVLDCCRNG